MRHYRAIAAGIFSLAATTGALGAQGRGRGRGEEKHEEKQEAAGRVVVVPREEQARRIEAERARTEAYRRNYDAEVAAVRARTAALDAARRAEAVRAQQAYAAQRAAELREVQTERNYARDPYITAPHTYRYVVQGTQRETNQYGVDVLRRAVNNGYQQGYRDGLADQRDRSPYNYRDDAAYRDANYGFRGAYVEQSDYNYYFREGFQRGYDDAYRRRLQYGTVSGGSASILANVLTGILGLATIR